MSVPQPDDKQIVDRSETPTHNLLSGAKNKLSSLGTSTRTNILIERRPPPQLFTPDKATQTPFVYKTPDRLTPVPHNTPFSGKSGEAQSLPLTSYEVATSPISLYSESSQDISPLKMNQTELMEAQEAFDKRKEAFAKEMEREKSQLHEQFQVERERLESEKQQFKIHMKEQKPSIDDDGSEVIAKMMGAMHDGRIIIRENLKKLGICDGSDPKTTRKWLRELHEMDHNLELAKLAAAGPLKEAIIAEKAKDWPTLRLALAKEFVSIDFAAQQKEELESLRQRSGESLVAFNYEFKTIASEAYPQPLTDEHELVRSYLSALHDRKMAEKVITHDRPDTLAKAMATIREKSRAGELLKPKQGKVHAIETIPPSSDKLELAIDKLTDRLAHLEASNQSVSSTLAQVAAVTKETKCFKCGKLGHFANKCPSKLSPQAAPFTPNPRAPSAANPCHKCGKAGHFAKECRSAAQVFPQAPHTQHRNKVNCARCRMTSHAVQNCRAPPPRTPCYCGGSHWLYDCPERRKQQGNYPAHQ